MNDLQERLRIPPEVQQERDGEAARIRTAERQPDGGGMLPSFVVLGGAPAAAPAPGLSAGASSALRLPDFTGQWNAAADAKKAAVGKVEGALTAKAAEMEPLEQRIKAAGANMPVAPKLEKVPDKFQYTGMSNEDMQAQLGVLFAFSALTGAMTRTPMTAAMKAYGAGIQGLMQGDQLAYKRGAEDFDRNMKAAIAKNQEAVSEYKLAMDRNAGDIGNMMNEWKLIAAKHQDTVMQANIERQDAETMMRHIESVAKMTDQAEKTRQAMERDSQRLLATVGARDADRASRERIADQKLQEKRALAEKAAGQGGKPTATERQHYMDSNRLVKDVERVRGMLSDPAIKAKVDAQQLGGILSDTADSKVIQQYLVRPNLDPDVKNYLTAISLLRNQYYLDQSGKAVTGGEALRNYGAVVQPGDTSDDVLNKMEIMSQRAGERMKDYETYFPTLRAIQPGGAPGAGAPAGGPPRSFSSEAEAAGAGLQPGTKVIINGVSGTWQ